MKTCLLDNFGNTCYLNTLLQCLSHCDSLYATLKQKTKIHNMLCHELFKVIDDMRNTESKSVAVSIPKRFIYNGLYSIIHDAWNDQQDIHEIYMFIVMAMNQHKNAEPHIKNQKTFLYNLLCQVNQEKQKDVMQIGKSMIEQRYKDFDKACDDTILHIFYGQIIQQIICANCSKKHRNFEHMSFLSIDSNCGSVSKGLQNIFKTQDLRSAFGSIHTDWKCDNCNSISPSSKYTKRIYRLPDVLVIVIHRFDKNMKKRTDEINIPQKLHMSSLCLCNTIRKKKYTYYILKAIGAHIGKNIENGHYISIVKENETFVIKDDDCEKSIKDLRNIQQNAYMLFYEKKDYVGSESL